MLNTTQTTIDSAGRLVIPKSVRTEAGLEPGVRLNIRCRDGVVQIEPAPRQVQTEHRGHVCVAVPLNPAEALDNETVQRVTQSIRNRGTGHA